MEGRIYILRRYYSREYKILYLKGKLAILGKAGMALFYLPKENFSFECNTSFFVIKTREKALFRTFSVLLGGAIEDANFGNSVTMELRGLGYKIYKEGGTLRFTLGLSHGVYYPLRSSFEVTILDKKNSVFRLVGVAKDSLSQRVKELKKLRPLDPYKGKGISKKSDFLALKPGKKEFR